MIDITEWDNRKIKKFGKEIFSGMDRCLMDIEYINRNGKNCQGNLCTYPDLDIDEDLPTFVRYIRTKESNDESHEEREVITLSWGDIDKDCHLAEEIKEYLKQNKNESFWTTQKARHDDIMRNFELHLGKRNEKCKKD